MTLFFSIWWWWWRQMMQRNEWMDVDHNNLMLNSCCDDENFRMFFHDGKKSINCVWCDMLLYQITEQTNTWVKRMDAAPCSHNMSPVWDQRTLCGRSVTIRECCLRLVLLKRLYVCIFFHVFCVSKQFIACCCSYVAHTFICFFLFCYACLFYDRFFISGGNLSICFCLCWIEQGIEFPPAVNPKI